MNPFFYGNPVNAKQFVNRKKALRRVISRLLSQGQSTAIIGQPLTGKTSILEYLAAQDNAEKLYGPHKGSLIFNLINIQMLGGQFSQAQFWELALSNVVDILIADI